MVWGVTTRRSGFSGGPSEGHEAFGLLDIDDLGFDVGGIIGEAEPGDLSDFEEEVGVDFDGAGVGSDDAEFEGVGVLEEDDRDCGGNGVEILDFLEGLGDAGAG